MLNRMIYIFSLIWNFWGRPFVVWSSKLKHIWWWSHLTQQFLVRGCSSSCPGWSNFFWGTWPWQGYRKLLLRSVLFRCSHLSFRKFGRLHIMHFWKYLSSHKQGSTVISKCCVRRPQPRELYRIRQERTYSPSTVFLLAYQLWQLQIARSRFTHRPLASWT